MDSLLIMHVGKVVDLNAYYSGKCLFDRARIFHELEYSSNIQR